MKQIIEKIIQRLKCNTPIDDAKRKEALNHLDFGQDPDFIEFILHCDGAEGFVTPDKFILFWSITDLVNLNPYYPGSEECRDLFFFGSDGANFGYAIDKQDNAVVGVDFMEIGESKPLQLGDSFADFLTNLIA